MKKKILAVVLSGISVNAMAAEAPKVKLGGEIGTEVFFKKEKAPYNTILDPNVSSKGALHKHGIVNDTRVTVQADGNANGLKYGGKVTLFADTSASPTDNTNHAEEVYGYVESKFGRAEAGSPKSASHKMMISGASVARATGGIDGNTNLHFNQFTNDKTTNTSNETHFVLCPGLPTFAKAKSRANKAVYYSPNFKGLQFGASYIPDVSMNGTASQVRTTTTNSGSYFKDIFEATVRYNSKVKDVSYGVSLSGETGKAKNGSNSNPDRHGIKAWVLGAMAEYKGFSVAGSYSDWTNTGEPKQKLSGAKFGSKHWTLGTAYEYKNFGVSATYMESKNANAYINQAVAKASQEKSYSKYKILSLGADYKVAEGLTTYVEVSPFKFDRPASVANNKGTVVLVGSKLKF